MKLSKEVVDLQKSLAKIDLYSSSGSSGMGFLVLKLESIKIKMYQEPGHKLAHIHIDYGTDIHTASYSIKPPERLEGNLNKKYNKEIISWVAKNESALMQLWSECQKGNEVENIIAKIQSKT